jgi:hypothetical protein
MAQPPSLDHRQAPAAAAAADWSRGRAACLRLFARDEKTADSEASAVTALAAGGFDPGQFMHCRKPR